MTVPDVEAHHVVSLAQQPTLEALYDARTSVFNWLSCIGRAHNSHQQFVLSYALEASDGFAILAEALKVPPVQVDIL